MKLRISKNLKPKAIIIESGSAIIG